MLASSLLAPLLLASSTLAASVPQQPAADLDKRNQPWPCPGKIAPKFMIISLFSYEANVWYGIPDFNLLAQNITIPGLSPLFPAIHCTANGEICQVVTGEAEINAASTITALLLSDKFDLRKTYFGTMGIAGVNPKHGTTGDVVLARYAVQVALQYEFDAREIPANFSTGYVPFGTVAPGMYPTTIYGTEVFELNVALRDKVLKFAQKAKLNDSSTAAAYRAHYTGDINAAARKAPSVKVGDVATSDVYYSGTLLGDAFGNYTTFITNGTGVYVTTAEEDNGSLEAFLRAALFELIDFSRIYVMRTCSDFDRPYPGEADTVNLFYADQGGFEPALQNIYLAGRQIIKGVIDNWESEFKAGIKPTNYIGDIFDSLGGTPDYGYPPAFIGDQVHNSKKRGLSRKSVREQQRSRLLPEMALPQPY